MTKQKSTHRDVFRDFFHQVEPIRFKEPFAETLGVFKKEDAVLEYTFIDVVKMTGHACPTTAGAYLCCKEALNKLYPDELPKRGDISITVFGEPDEGENHLRHRPPPLHHSACRSHSGGLQRGDCGRGSARRAPCKGWGVCPASLHAVFEQACGG